MNIGKGTKCLEIIYLEALSPDSTILVINNYNKEDDK